MRARSATLGVCVVLSLGLGCKQEPTASPEPAGADLAEAEIHAWEVYEGLEARIAGPGASESARKAALERVRTAPDDGSARYAFARAAVAGRLAETRGLKALKLLDEMNEWAKKSIERDPAFDGMAATRMLGTLHVLAGQHVDGGDSEYGLELLEAVVDAHPDDATSQLRLAQGYVALGDAEAGFESLCAARAGREGLDAEETELLDGLLDDIGGADLLPCAEGGQ